MTMACQPVLSLIDITTKYLASLSQSEVDNVYQKPQTLNNDFETHLVITESSSHKLSITALSYSYRKYSLQKKPELNIATMKS